MSGRCKFRVEENGPECLRLRDHEGEHRLPDGRVFSHDSAPYRPARISLVDEAGHPVEPGDINWIHSQGPIRDCTTVLELYRLRWKDRSRPAPEGLDEDDLDTLRSGLSFPRRRAYLPQEADILEG